MKNLLNKSLILGLIVGVVLTFGGAAIAAGGVQKVFNISGDYIEAEGEAMVGGVVFEKEIFVGEVEMEDTLSVAGAATFSSTLDVSGKADFDAGIVFDTGSIVATSTLTSIDDNYQLLGASAVFTTITLPAVEAGLRYKFIVTGALTGEETLIASAEGDNISGLLQVNGADVACSLEDQINIITDGEVIGDFVELVSDGTSWFLTGSQADAASKMTCTDPS